MYKIKDEIILPIHNQKKFAEEIGVTPESLSRILNKRQNCSKTLAYAITKNFDNNFELNDIFERVEE